MIASYCELLRFPAEATACLAEAYRDLTKKYDLSVRFFAIREAFLQPGNKTYLEMLQALAEESGTDRRTLDMVFLLWCAPALREEYVKREIPDSVFVDTMSDLRFKLLECYDNYGVWGTFVTYWYPGFYQCDRFALGRLQFEKRQLKHTAYGILREGDDVLNCHIPSGGPLSPEAVLASLKKAYAFYADVQKDGILPVVCHSWLLYPPHYALFGRNTRDFHDLFKILKQEVSAENGDFWRVFNRPFSEDVLADLPEDTSLRRGLKQFLLAGNSMGNGYGILLFDGERVLPRL